MAAPNQIPVRYRRLSGYLFGYGVRRQSFAVSSRNRLWLGPDHVLSVDAQWYAEDYRRFYFRDIQAFIIRKTRNGFISNIVAGVIAFCIFAGSLVSFASGGAGGGIVLGIIGAFPLGILLINTLVGPTCTCHIKTAVQLEELPTLRRLRRARRLINRLRPLIVEAQGEFSPLRTAAAVPVAEPAPTSNAGTGLPPIIGEPAEPGAPPATT